VADDIVDEQDALGVAARAMARELGRQAARELYATSQRPRMVVTGGVARMQSPGGVQEAEKVPAER
jgi:hypothetical protein